MLSVGRCNVLLGLVAMTTDVESLYASVKALVYVIKCNGQAQQEMEQLRGYQTLADTGLSLQAPQVLTQQRPTVRPLVGRLRQQGRRRLQQRARQQFCLWRPPGRSERLARDGRRLASSHF